MKGFRNAINACGFQDMGYEGPNFAWCNRRFEGERIHLRLDRVLATIDWMELYRNSKVYCIVDSTSNHCALLLTNQQALPNHGKRQFHFEVALQSSNGLVEGLKDCASRLARWK